METITKLFPETNFKPALPGNAVSKFFCHECKNPLAHMTARKLMVNSKNSTQTFCDWCYVEQTTNQVIMGIEESSLKLVNFGTAKSFVWYHASIVENWLGTVQDGGYSTKEKNHEPLYVHCGTYEAAITISKIRFNEGAEKVIIHGVKIIDDATMSENIFKDMDEQWPTKTNNASKSLLGSDAIRYINRWEEPGSVSILVDSSKLVEVSVDEFSLRDFSKKTGWERFGTYF